ncbi:hypothetical protein BpHYR1_004565 [Brachionus plicatilis]|uniref:Uncharacterized protein n=1 Tax=Brachionus plicatilis TaxID=10195 RepID=A0A3M7Q304_BRAPC|nr:hypothetical protein BpHYR1_004565 [Brachionus plicatilis]
MENDDEAKFFFKIRDFGLFYNEQVCLKENCYENGHKMELKTRKRDSTSSICKEFMQNEKGVKLHTVLIRHVDFT